MNHPARATDVGTSHEAAHHLIASCQQAVQQDRAAKVVQQHLGLTSMELARATGHDRYMLARRLPELLEGGRAWRGPKKLRDTSGRSACTWWPVAPGDNYALAV